MCHQDQSCRHQAQGPRSSGAPQAGRSQPSHRHGPVRTRRGHQPSSASLRQLLRALLPLRVVFPGEAHRRASRPMGHAKVQATTHPQAWTRRSSTIPRDPTHLNHPPNRDPHRGFDQPRPRSPLDRNRPLRDADPRALLERSVYVPRSSVTDRHPVDGDPPTLDHWRTTRLSRGSIGSPKRSCAQLTSCACR